MRTLFAAALGLLAVASATQAADVTTAKLDNGMEIVVIEDHRAPAVVHMVWYRVGSADEEPGESGIAHFLEHLMFGATESLAKGELSETVALNGGSDNAFTSYDYTAYHQRVAADRLELMMKMEASRMRGLRISPDDIATERDVIIEERNQRTENDPGALFGEQIRAALFLNHRYGIPVIGWKHEAEALTLDDAVSFYERHYGPNNAILVVAGDVEPDEVVRLARVHYGPVPENPAIEARNRPTEPPQLAERRLAYSDTRIAQPYLVRYYLAPERNPGDQQEAAALTLFAELLGGSGTTSFLAEKLQFEDRKAIYTSAFYSGMSLDYALFGLVIVPSDGVSLAEAEADLDATVSQFLESGIDMDDLDRIKMQIRASEIYAQDDTRSLANLYGSALANGLTVADVEAWPAILDAVTPEAILEAGRRVLNRKQAATGWVMPEGAEEQMQ